MDARRAGRDEWPDIDTAKMPRERTMDQPAVWWGGGGVAGSRERCAVRVGDDARSDRGKHGSGRNIAQSRQRGQLLERAHSQQGQCGSQHGGRDGGEGGGGGEQRGLSKSKGQGAHRPPPKLGQSGKRDQGGASFAKGGGAEGGVGFWGSRG